jgi:hydroxyethylthiazole kinase-like uncharacterized protein yjeF
MKVSTVEQMRKLDSSAIRDYGITQEILMENAGQATYFVILDQIGVEGKKFVIFCGPGNNGGDGLVVARKISSQGGSAKVFLMSDKGKFKGAAKQNFEIFSRLSDEIRGVEDMDEVESSTEESDVIVDAIFGTGITRDVEGKYKKVINLINKSKKTTVSVDIPSGVNGDNGKIMGTAVISDYTVTYGLPKVGNLLYPGYQKCGKLYVTHISFPPKLYNKSDHKIETAQPLPLPERPGDGHKGTFGKALFIAGSKGYYGAPHYSALSFLKAGGGYSRLATPESVTPFIATEGKEIVFIPLTETSDGSIAAKNKKQLATTAGEMDMVVLGPGISLNRETQELARDLVKEIECPLLIDGDGITAISEQRDILQSRSAPTVLTPHPGEMSRLTSRSMSEIEENRIPILREECKALNSIIVLKGAHSLTGTPDGKVRINMSGNPGMGTAGSGDVLTGCIAAMFGLGLPLEEAVTTGVFMHGFSGDLAAAEKGEDGITARDIMNFLPPAVKKFRENPHQVFSNHYHSIYRI